MAFLKSVQTYFPNVYDVKLIADHLFQNGFRSSLYNLSQCLEVDRDDDAEHQAGSDSKVTAKCFFKLKEEDDSLWTSFNG